MGVAKGDRDDYLGVNARHFSGKDVALNFPKILDICNQGIRMILHVHA